jgi:RNA polymerase sigma factor (sigma-70 family)
MSATDNRTILQKYLENYSEEAFAALVTRHINLVYSVALRQVGNPHHAEEITQAVFIILARKASQLRHDKALSSWLFQTTRLTAVNFVRSETRRYRHEQEAYMQAVLDESGENVWQRIAPLLDTAVAALSEKDRHVIVLRFYEGKNLRDVGLALGASEEAAKKRVSRALEKLRNFFARRGVASTTAMIAGAFSANPVHAAPVALAKTVTAAVMTKSAAGPSTLTLAKGVLKFMAYKKAMAIAVGTAVALLIGGTTAVVVKETQTGRGPLGSVLTQKKALMAQMDSLKPVSHAVRAFAREHQNQLPQTINQFQRYLPENVRLDDEHWEMMATGKVTPQLLNQNPILLQQKNIAPGKAKIILYLDGSILYRN